MRRRINRIAALVAALSCLASCGKKHNTYQNIDPGTYELESSTFSRFLSVYIGGGYSAENAEEKKFEGYKYDDKSGMYLSSYVVYAGFAAKPYARVLEKVFYSNFGFKTEEVEYSYSFIDAVGVFEVTCNGIAQQVTIPIKATGDGGGTCAFRFTSESASFASSIRLINISGMVNAPYTRQATLSHNNFIYRYGDAGGQTVVPEGLEERAKEMKNWTFTPSFDDKGIKVLARNQVAFLEMSDEVETVLFDGVYDAKSLGDGQEVAFVAGISLYAIAIRKIDPQAVFENVELWSGKTVLFFIDDPSGKFTSLLRASNDNAVIKPFSEFLGA